MKIFLIPLIVAIGLISNFSIASARHACFFGVICLPHSNTNSYNDCRSAGCANDEICTNNRPGPSFATDPYFCKKKSEPMYRGMTSRTSSVGPTPQSISLPRPTTPTYALTPQNIPTTQTNPATTPCIPNNGTTQKNNTNNNPTSGTGWCLPGEMVNGVFTYCNAFSSGGYTECLKRNKDQCSGPL